MKKFQSYIYDKHRTELYSDGVFAIIITLLVLEIKVPEIPHNADVFTAITTIWMLKSKIISWVISFLMVSVGWTQHHNILHMSKKADLAMIWLNIFILMTFCLVPFTAALMGDNPMNATAISLYGIALAISSFFMCLMYRYICKYQLKDSYDKKSVRKNVKIAIVLGPLLFIVAALSAFISPYISYIIYALIPIAFIFPLDKENVN